MVMKLIKNEEKHYEFIRKLRTDKRNASGFFEQVDITTEQQKKYMEKYSDCYYICIQDDIPVGFIGAVDNDVRLASLPELKGTGIGKFMLTEFMKTHPNASAKVMLENEVSNNLFQKYGFIGFKKDENFIYYKYDTKEN